MANTRGETKVNKLRSFKHTHTHTYTLQDNNYLSPGVHGFVSSVAEPSPSTDTGVPLLVFGVVGRKVDGVGPSLQKKTQSLNQNWNFKK